MRGLYAICDTDTLHARGVDVLDFARALLEARPCALQLRAKSLSDDDCLALLRELRPLCDAARVPLVCNDRPDLALAARCDAVHLGQADLLSALAPWRGPRAGGAGDVPSRLDVGISTHTLDQLADALARRPAYVAFGPVFSTLTKKDASPTVGLDALERARARATLADVPLVAIGGITLDTAAAVGARCSAIAVISDLLGPTPTDASSVTARAMAFRRAAST